MKLICFAGNYGWGFYKKVDGVRTPYFYHKSGNGPYNA